MTELTLTLKRLAWALLLGVMVIASAPNAAAQETPEAAVSEAETHFRLGVSLYKDGNYRESLDEFRRALALDPGMTKAEEYSQKAEAQLNLSSVGIDPTQTPEFETFDPESLGPVSETPQLSPEEHKIQRVRELVELGEQYLEFQLYEPARDHFEQVLLIAPDNKRAQQGLHEATIGVFREEKTDVRTLNQEQAERFRTHVERMKQLPEGADPNGIKGYRISVPSIEETPAGEPQRTHIEEVLDNPVGVVFEDIHLRDILEFVTDTYEVNIVVDGRVIEPPVEEEAEEEEAAPTRGRRRPTRARAGQETAIGGMIDYINLKNVTLGDALTAILRPLNLAYSVESTFIWISTPEKIRTESFEDLETRYYQLNYFGNETLFKITLSLGSLTGSGGGGGGGGEGGNVETEAFFDSMTEVFESFTQDNQVGEESGRFARRGGGGGADVYEAGTGGLGPQDDLEGEPNSIDLLRSLIPDVFEPGSETLLSYLFFQPLTNILVVHNTASHLNEFERKLYELDVTPKQVSIEAKFLTIDISDRKAEGFRWQAEVGNRQEVFGVDPNDPGDSFADLSSDFDVDGDGDLDEIPFQFNPDGSRKFSDDVKEAVLGALVNPAGPSELFSLTGILEKGDDGDFLAFTYDFVDSMAESELLSAPRVTTLNQKPAIIADTRSEFFLTNVDTQAETGTNTGSDTAITTITQDLTITEFRFGIGLTVTPHINERNEIRLWLNPIVQSKLGEKTFQTAPVIPGTEVEEQSVITLPLMAVQSVWTNVIVNDGDTLVLGGTVSDSSARAEDKMPYLSKIPVIGYFFRGKSNDVKQTSLLIFVTPEIIDTTGARYFDTNL